MTPTEQKYIEKLKELVKFLEYPQYHEVRESINRKKAELAELGKQCQFELLCDPDIYEANTNEHFESELKQSQDFPDIDFRKDIAEELTRDELIDRLCEMNESYKAMRKEWFEKTQVQEQSQVKTAEEIYEETNHAFQNPLPEKGEEMYDAIINMMHEYRNQGLKLPTKEEIAKEFPVKPGSTLNICRRYGASWAIAFITGQEPK